jgi:hypothetical protein
MIASPSGKKAEVHMRSKVSGFDGNCARVIARQALKRESGSGAKTTIKMRKREKKKEDCITLQN